MDKGWFLPSFSVAEADSGNVFFFLFSFSLYFRLCFEAVLAQGARPSQPGHVLEPLTPKNTVVRMKKEEEGTVLK